MAIFGSKTRRSRKTSVPNGLLVQVPYRIDLLMRWAERVLVPWKGKA